MFAKKHSLHFHQLCMYCNNDKKMNFYCVKNMKWSTMIVEGSESHRISENILDEQEQNTNKDKQLGFVSNYDKFKLTAKSISLNEC